MLFRLCSRHITPAVGAREGLQDGCFEAVDAGSSVVGLN